MPDGMKFSEFVAGCRKNLAGDEKGRAQFFWERLLQAFGQPGGLKVDGMQNFASAKPAGMAAAPRSPIASGNSSPPPVCHLIIIPPPKTGDGRLPPARNMITPASTPAAHPRDPLHGITLENILNQLVQRHGWSEMGRRIPIRCFQFNPSVKSSLTFLRKTPWARKRVEDWFIAEL
jgi:hypothetical protein